MPVWRRRAANGRRDTSFDTVRTEGSWGKQEDGVGRSVAPPRREGEDDGWVVG